LFPHSKACTPPKININRARTSHGNKMIFTTISIAAPTITPVTQTDQSIYFYLPKNTTTDIHFIEKCETDFTFFYSPLQIQCFIQGVKAQMGKTETDLVTFKKASHWYLKQHPTQNITDLNTFIGNILLDNPSNAPITSINFEQ